MTLTPDEAIAWGRDIFQQFNLTWEVLEQLPNDPAVRLRGRTVSQAGVLDLTLQQEQTVRRVTIVVPVKPEYTALVVYTLATLAKATHSQADTVLEQLLRSLAHRAGTRTVRWGMWQVEVSTAVVIGNTFLTVVITPGGLA